MSITERSRESNINKNRKRKLEIEYDLKTNPNDPRYTFEMPNKMKSKVWSRFRIVKFQGAEENFARCNICREILSYSVKCGTGSLLRHTCLKKSKLYMLQGERNRNQLDWSHLTVKNLIQVKDLCNENYSNTVDNNAALSKKRAFLLDAPQRSASEHAHCPQSGSSESNPELMELKQSENLAEEESRLEWDPLSLVAVKTESELILDDRFSDDQHNEMGVVYKDWSKLMAQTVENQAAEGAMHDKFVSRNSQQQEINEPFITLSDSSNCSNKSRRSSVIDLLTQADSQLKSTYVSNHTSQQEFHQVSNQESNQVYQQESNEISHQEPILTSHHTSTKISDRPSEQGSLRISIKRSPQISQQDLKKTQSLTLSDKFKPFNSVQSDHLNSLLLSEPTAFEKRLLEINEKMLKEKMKQTRIAKKRLQLLKKQRKDQKEQTKVLNGLLKQLVNGKSNS